MSISHSTPKITVITPSYNQGQFLEETIDSILSQNYPNLEYIIIDGNSKDNSVEIIKKYEKHLSYWESTPDNGQTEAINKGLKKSSGELITWICSDDLLLENALHQAASYFNQYPNLSLIHGKTRLFGTGEERITDGFYSDLNIDYYLHLPFPQPSSFFHRSVIDEQGLLDESLHYCMDYDLLLRIVLNYETLKVDTLFSAYRLHPASKTVSQQEKFEIERNKLFLRLLRSLNAQKEIAFLEKIGITSDENHTYSIQKPPQHLDKLVFTFLYRKLNTLFEQKNYQQLIVFTELLQQTYPLLFEEHKQNFTTLYQTSKYNSLSVLGKLGWKAKKLLFKR